MVLLAERLHAVTSGPGPYVGRAPQTIALMRRLQVDFGEHPLVTLAYGPAGPQWVSDEMLIALVQDAADHGLGLHMHLLESPVQLRVLKQRYPAGLLSHLEKSGALGPMTTLAHGIYLDSAAIEVISRTGTNLVHNPGSNLRLSNGLAPLPQLLAAGDHVAIGTDNCAFSDTEDLLSEAHLADLLARREPHIHLAKPASWLERITVTGARAAFAKTGAGVIAQGICADLVALKLDRITDPYLDEDMPLLDLVAMRAQGRDVVMTLVAGRLRWLHGKLVDQDLPAIVLAAAQTARDARMSTREGAAEAAQALTMALRELHGLT